MKYLVIIEKTSTGYSAYTPDLDGCIATGASKEEVEQNIKEAIEFHLDGLNLGGSQIPDPHSHAQYVDVAPQQSTRTDHIQPFQN